MNNLRFGWFNLMGTVLSKKYFNDPRTTAILWILIIIFTLFCVFVFTGWGYFKFDVLVIWCLSCFSVLYLSQNIPAKDSYQRDWNQILLGLFFMIFSFINIPIGFGNPPYSIGDFSIFLSGVSLVFFGIIGVKNYFLPVILPAVAVIGFQFYEKFNIYFHWLSEPLIPPIVASTAFLLKTINAESIITGNTISFTSLTGEYVNLIISTDCTGIWSIGTFTITCIIILVSFPEARTLKSCFLLFIGYIGTFSTNILRVWFIILVGYVWGSHAAVKSAHDYFGWLIFTVWLIIFWYFFITRHLGLSIFDKIRNK